MRRHKRVSAKPLPEKVTSTNEFFLEPTSVSTTYSSIALANYDAAFQKEENSGQERPLEGPKG